MQNLLPDGLHPNAAGMDVMASCLEAAIAPLMRDDGSIGSIKLSRVIASDIVASIDSTAVNSSVLERELGN